MSSLQNVTFLQNLQTNTLALGLALASYLLNLYNETGHFCSAVLGGLSSYNSGNLATDGGVVIEKNSYGYVKSIIGPNFYIPVWVGGCVDKKIAQQVFSDLKSQLKLVEIEGSFYGITNLDGTVPSIKQYSYKDCPKLTEIEKQEFRLLIQQFVDSVKKCPESITFSDWGEKKTVLIDDSSLGKALRVILENLVSFVQMGDLCRTQDEWSVYAGGSSVGEIVRHPREGTVTSTVKDERFLPLVELFKTRTKKWQPQAHRWRDPTYDSLNRAVWDWQKRFVAVFSEQPDLFIYGKDE